MFLYLLDSLLNFMSLCITIIKFLFTFFVLPYAITFFEDLGIMKILLLSMEVAFKAILSVFTTPIHAFLAFNFTYDRLQFENHLSSYPRNY